MDRQRRRRSAKTALAKEDRMIRNRIVTRLPLAAAALGFTLLAPLVSGCFSNRGGSSGSGEGGGSASTSATGAGSGSGGNTANAAGAGGEGGGGGAGAGSTSSSTGAGGEGGAPAGGAAPTLLGSRLVVWLDGEKGVISSSGKVIVWADQSGSENDALSPASGGGTAPTRQTDGIGGRPAIQFASDTAYLRIPDSASLHFGTDEIVAAAVLRHTSGLASESRIVVTKQWLDFPYVGMGLFVNYSGGVGAGAQVIYSPQVAASFAPATGTYADDQPRLVVFHRAGEQLELRINGASVAITGGGGIDLSTSAEVRIGGQGAAFQALRGSIAEIMVVRGAISGGELGELEHYLMEKYQLTP
jgi:hypothetical protein